jgi:hypothetical protein
VQGAQKTLDRMLLTLWRAGYVQLEPPPPPPDPDSSGDVAVAAVAVDASSERLRVDGASQTGTAADGAEEPVVYRPSIARPTPAMDKLVLLRGINPLYGVFLVNQLGIADRNERLQAMESVLEIPGSVAYHLHVPPHDELPPGPLATTRLDVTLLQLGLASAEELGAGEASAGRRGRSATIEHVPGRPRLGIDAGRKTETSVRL